MGPWDGAWGVPGIAPSRHPSPPHPGYTSPYPHSALATGAPRTRGTKEAVGLKSVGQLSLSAQISRFRGITEVYNLVKVRDPNDHKCIPGNE